MQDNPETACDPPDLNFVKEELRNILQLMFNI